MSDILLEGRWSPRIEVLRGAGMRFWLMLGVRFGTGKCDERDQNGDFVPVRYQLGTGTTDPYCGVETCFSLVSLNRLKLTLQYQMNSENRAGYERGDTLSAKLLWGTVVKRFYFGFGASLLSVLKHDRQDGIIVPDTRGEFIYIEMESAYRLTPRLNLNFYIRYLVSSASVKSENALRWQAGTGVSVSF